jgi:hypothetical protein
MKEKLSVPCTYSIRNSLYVHALQQNHDFFVTPTANINLILPVLYHISHLHITGLGLLASVCILKVHKIRIHIGEERKIFSYTDWN